MQRSGQKDGAVEGVRASSPLARTSPARRVKLRSADAEHGIVRV